MIFFQQGKLYSEEHDAFRKALFYFELEEGRTKTKYAGGLVGDTGLFCLAKGFPEKPDLQFLRNRE